MHQRKMAEYRKAAAQCQKWTDQETDPETAADWQAMADGWARRAENLERKLKPSEGNKNSQ